MSVDAEQDGRSTIFAIGASAGGVGALRSLVEMLPADFSGSVFVVLHSAPRSPGYLAPILDAAGPLPALLPDDGEEIGPGRIYVAPPDRHLIVRRDHVHLSRGAKENRTRPSDHVLPLAEEAELATVLEERGRSRSIDEGHIEHHEARARALERLGDEVEALIRPADRGNESPTEA